MRLPPPTFGSPHGKSHTRGTKQNSGGGVLPIMRVLPRGKKFRCREGRPADVATFRASPAGNGEGEADWGLVPLVIETGDVLQLPAGAATACWDPVRAEVDTSDAVGRHVWDAIARDNVFVLDAVLRQVRAPRHCMQPACLL